MRTIILILALCFFAMPAEAELPKLEGYYWNTGEFSYQGPLFGDLQTQEKAAAILPPPQAAIAIIIDDMGVDRKRSLQAAQLPAAVTLSYLPYADHVQAQVDAAREAGHEIMLHLPMEPDSDNADAGPHHLSDDMSPDDIRENLEKSLAGFKGYAGVNNHMGSKFSRNAEGLLIVMRRLKGEGGYFVDSKTSASSIAEKIARMHDIPATYRDVFLDHVNTDEFVAEALRKAETLAFKNGSSLVIGHPRDVTIGALERWIPTLREKGIELVPASRLIEKRSTEVKSVSASFE